MSLQKRTPICAWKLTVKAARACAQSSYRPLREEAATPRLENDD
jgi:hypothetical protein